MFRMSTGGPEQGLVLNLSMVKTRDIRASVDGREREELVVAVVPSIPIRVWAFRFQD